MRYFAHAALTITPEQKAAALDLSAFALKAYKQNMRLKYKRFRLHGTYVLSA